LIAENLVLPGEHYLIFMAEAQRVAIQSILGILNFSSFSIFYPTPQVDLFPAF